MEIKIKNQETEMAVNIIPNEIYQVWRIYLEFLEKNPAYVPNIIETILHSR